eukprot:4281402-Prymnesium_polylepis.1
MVLYVPVTEASERTVHLRIAVEARGHGHAQIAGKRARPGVAPGCEGRAYPLHGGTGGGGH